MLSGLSNSKSPIFNYSTTAKNLKHIIIDGKLYKLVETVCDGNCGADACKQLLAQAGIKLDNSLDELRREIAVITSVSIEFNLKYGNSDTIGFLIIVKYLQQAFKGLPEFKTIAITDLEGKVRVQEKDCPKGNQEVLHDIAAKKTFISILKECREWDDLQALYDLDTIIFISFIKALLHVDNQHVFHSHGIHHSSLEQYSSTVSTSKSWFTNVELICFLHYYGLGFAEYKSQKDGVILVFLNKEYKEFFCILMLL
jgi:hypothetical protein